MELIKVKHRVAAVGVFIITVSLTRSQPRYPITCGEEICGYGTQCSGRQCGCAGGFSDFMGTTVKLCLKACFGENDQSCKDNTTCTYVTAIATHRCLCSEGYTRSSQTRECIDKNECVEKLPICKQGLECVNTVGSYRCVTPTVTDDGGEGEQSTESMSTANSIQISPYTITGPWSTVFQTGNTAPSTSLSGVIAAAVFGALFGILVIGVIIYCVIKHRRTISKRRRHNSDTNHPTYININEDIMPPNASQNVSLYGSPSPAHPESHDGTVYIVGNTHGTVNTNSYEVVDVDRHGDGTSTQGVLSNSAPLENNNVSRENRPAYMNTAQSPSTNPGSYEVVSVDQQEDTRTYQSLTSNGDRGDNSLPPDNTPTTRSINNTFERIEGQLETDDGSAPGYYNTVPFSSDYINPVHVAAD